MKKILFITLAIALFGCSIESKQNEQFDEEFKKQLFIITDYDRTAYFLDNYGQEGAKNKAKKNCSDLRNGVSYESVYYDYDDFNRDLDKYGSDAVHKSYIERAILRSSWVYCPKVFDRERKKYLQQIESQKD